MNVLLIGNGARENAIAEVLTKSRRVQLSAFGKAKNPGIIRLAQAYHTGSLADFSAILDFARTTKPEFAVIGPDDPIAEGLADALAEIGIRSVAPLKTNARLESSKSFARDLLEKHDIPGNPRFRVFTSASGLRSFLEELGGSFVVKADGLMGGKGVKVSGDHLADIEEGLVYAQDCLARSGRVVIEEKLVGQEFSLMSFVSGGDVLDMIPVQDHKRAFEGDAGENTGGMGSYSDADHSLPFLEPRDLAQAHAITEHVAAALWKETGTPYRGVMYGGFMAVADGVRLIEYNARFGDPEAMNVLPILETDFVEVCEAILAERLGSLRLSFARKATVCKYLVPEGYPSHPRAGEKIRVDEALRGSCRLYYSSVDERADGLYLSSSRALAFVGIANSLAQAEQSAEQACCLVSGPLYHRRDIGTAELVGKRVAMMRQLRGSEKL